MELNVVVFNYWPRALADVYVDKHWVGGGYGGYTERGGTGSKVSCCFPIRSGPVRLAWMLDGAEGDPLTGTTMHAEVTLPAIKPGARYLAVYLYPDGTAALDTGASLPPDRHQPTNARP